MRAIYLPIGLASLCCFLGGQIYGSFAAASRAAATSAEVTLAPEAEGDTAAGASPVEPGDHPAARIDLFGNEIENAVEDYRIDLGGGVYERHAPETLEARLAAPSS